MDGQFLNVPDLAGAVAGVRERAAAGHGFTFFTLNLDHLVKLRDHAGFRDAYRAATFVSADGWPVALLAGRGGPRRDPSAVRVTTGADLVVPLCATAAADGLPVYLFGATEESLFKAAAALRATSPGLDIRGWHAPPFGFDPLSPAAEADADRIAASGARLVFVALGAPKQELFAARAATRHPGLGLVCVGAALDFLSGAQVRAPRPVRAARLEWLWRLAHAPKALSGRYARCAALLFGLAVAEPALRRLGLRRGPARSARPFACDDGVFRLFAATPDAGVDPALIVATLVALRARLDGRVEFHLVGAGDPESWPGFAAIRDLTVHHGMTDAAGTARIMAPCHAGLLVAFAEDGPGLLREGLASGRPFGALRPARAEASIEAEALIEAGLGGFLVERGADTGASAERLAEHFVRLWDAIRQGRVDPDAIHAHAASHAVTVRIGRLSARHRAVQGGVEGEIQGEIQGAAVAPADSVTAA